MEAPRFYEGIRDMTRAWFGHAKNARSVFRRAGVRTVVSTPNAASPILSLPGTKVFAISCSVELQALIDAFVADPSDANKDALMGYIESELGQSIEEAFPEEWEVAKNGTLVTITIELGTDTLALTLGPCAGSPEPGTCLDELQALIDVVQANPSSAAAMNALIDFIEDQTGSVIEELAGDVWEQVAEDGEEREVEVEVCGACVTLSIDGTLVGSRSCGHLPQFTLTLEQQDFHLEPIVVGSPTPGVDGDYRELLTVPEYDVHLEHPRLEWLAGIDDADIRDNMASPSFPNTFQEVGGQTYYPAIRINGYFTASLLLNHFRNVDTGGGLTDSYAYSYHPPPLGLKLIRRAPSGGAGLTIDDSLRLGTETFGSARGVANSDFCLLTGSEFHGAGYQAQGTNSQLMLNTVRNPHVWPILDGGGSGTLAAWAAFMVDVNDYNATRGPQQPTLEVDEVAKTVTISFMTRENAIYIKAWGCFYSAGTDDDILYDCLSVNYGGYYNHASASYDAAPHLQTNSLGLFSERLDFMQAYRSA